MEIGFYHPDRGYWQAVGVTDENHIAELLVSYPEGTIQVELKPGADYELVDGEWEYIEPTIQVPSQVSPAQAEIALYNFDNGVLLSQVNNLIDNYPYEPVRIWWRKATYISRYHPYLQALAIEIGLTDEMVDQLFIAASLI